MIISAVVFGSLGTLTETSALHHRAFNETFAAEGLDWYWDTAVYRELLGDVGGANRIFRYAAQAGSDSMTEEDAVALHGKKTERYAELVHTAGLSLRPGVERLIGEVRAAGLKLGLATGTSMDNIDTNLVATGDRISVEDFDAYTVRDSIEHAKPSPDAHLTCMANLGVEPSETVAIEDSAPGVASAAAAGSFVVATPGEYLIEQNFRVADVMVSSLGDQQIPTDFIAGPHSHSNMVTLDWLRSLND